MKFLPPHFYVKIYYEYYTGKKLNLENPVEFNEKIQWLKVYYQKPILTQLVDKFSVRAYVTETIGADYLNELLQVYDRVSEVDFDILPEQFVMKAVHGYHFNLIVPRKADLNLWKAKFLLHKWMGKNQYYRGGLEWAYKHVPPRIIVEKFLQQIGSTAISDYKFFCYNGIPDMVQIDVDRNTKHERGYYTMDWQKIPLAKIGMPIFEGQLERPRNFDEMVRIATTLAGSFPFVRVDLYNLDGRILFGEMTFYPADGRLDFYPDHFNKKFGDAIQLPRIPEGRAFIS